jgi:hypothetical protein
LVKGKWPKLQILWIGNKYFYLDYNEIGVEGMDWANLNEWRMLKLIWADPLPNISIMPLIAYTWDSEKYIGNYTKNVYIRNEM